MDNPGRCEISRSIFRPLCEINPARNFLLLYARTFVCFVCALGLHALPITCLIFTLVLHARTFVCIVVAIVPHTSTFASLLHLFCNVSAHACVHCLIDFVCIYLCLRSVCTRSTCTSHSLPHFYTRSTCTYLCLHCRCTRSTYKYLRFASTLVLQ